MRRCTHCIRKHARGHAVRVLCKRFPIMLPALRRSCHRSQCLRAVPKTLVVDLNRFEQLLCDDIRITYTSMRGDIS